MFREGEDYYLGTAVPSQIDQENRDKRAPGLYKCPECGDATITWHSVVDKYKIRCPKCSTEMRRVALVPKPVPVIIKVNALEEDAEQYGIRAWWNKKRADSDMRVQSEIAVGLETVRKRRTKIISAAAINKVTPDTRRVDRDIKLFTDILGGYKKAKPPYMSGKVARGVQKAHAGRNPTLGDVQRQYDMLTNAERKKLTSQIRGMRRRSLSGRAKLAVAGTGLAVAGLTAAGLLKQRQKHELDVLAEIYKNSPERARLAAAYVGVPLGQVIMHYAKKSTITGAALGLAHGKEEAAGSRSAPGALKLWLLQKLHGGSYVVGRQKGLSGKHGGTRSEMSVIGEIPKLLKEMVHGQAPAKAQLPQGA